MSAIKYAREYLERIIVHEGMPEALVKDLETIAHMVDLEVLEAGLLEKRPAPTVRVRINVSTSVKGVVTTDTTLEHFGDIRDLDLDVILQLRTELSMKVDSVYPPPPLT